MGGAFGGKETQPAHIAAIAALAATATGRPAKLRLDRDDDMIMTGKRHDFRIDYDVGFDDDGTHRRLDFDHALRCGMSADLSAAIADRAMFHADNAYYLPARITRSGCKTHTRSNTAFRGFGGPQGMIGIERVMDEIAPALGKDPLDVAQANFYGRARAGRDALPHECRRQRHPRDRSPNCEISPDYRARREAIRGASTATQPDPETRHCPDAGQVRHLLHHTHLNQAGALVHVYRTARSISITAAPRWARACSSRSRRWWPSIPGRLDRSRSPRPTTGKVPNTSATAASSGSDLNGMAAQNAAARSSGRLTDFCRAAIRSPRQVRFQPAGCTSASGHDLRRAGRRGLSGPGVALGHRLLRHAEDHWTTASGRAAGRSSISPMARRSAKS